jgi:hypothetical protein
VFIEVDIEVEVEDIEVEDRADRGDMERDDRGSRGRGRVGTAFTTEPHVSHIDVR